MLEVRYIEDNKILKPLYNNLLNNQEISGANAVLFEDDKAIGICQMSVGELVKINFISILPDFNTFINADFFIRVILFKLSKTGCEIAYKGYNKQMEKFGFVKTDDEMRVFAKDIQFPSSCNH